MSQRTNTSSAGLRLVASPGQLIGQHAVFPSHKFAHADADLIAYESADVLPHFPKSFSAEVLRTVAVEKPGLPVLAESLGELLGRLDGAELHDLLPIVVLPFFSHALSSPIHNTISTFFSVKGNEKPPLLVISENYIA
jgi:hypothetical protein